MNYLANVALLETIRSKSGKYYLDYFVSFLILAIDDLNELPDFMSFEELSSTLNKGLNLNIPTACIKLIVNRAKKRKFFEQSEQKYTPNRNNISKEALNLRKRRHEIEQAQVEFFKDFCKYVYDKYDKNINEEYAQSLFHDYFQKYHDQVTSLVLEKKQNQQFEHLHNEEYLISDYVTNIYNSKKVIFESLEKIFKGYLLANYICIRGTDSFKDDLKGSKIFLDTPVILGLMGLSGKSRENTNKELIELLTKLKVQIYAFEHTKFEVEGVISAWVNDLRNNNFKNFNPGTLDLLKARGLDAAALESFGATIGSQLTSYGIKVIRKPALKQEYSIDEQELEKILEIPGKYDGERVKRDIASVVGIYCLRNGMAKQNITDKPTVFVTTNNNYAVKVNAFFEKDEISKKSLSIVVTDTLITNLAWLLSPDVFPNLPKRLLITNCYGNIYGNSNFWQDFLNRLKRLRDSKLISPEDYGIVRFELDLKQCLEETAVINGLDYGDETVFQILQSTKNKILNKKDKQIALLQDELEKRDLHAERFARRVAKFCYRAFLILLVVIVILLSCICWIYSNTVIALCFNTLFVLLTFLGWSGFKQYKNKIEMFFFTKIYDFYKTKICNN